MDNSEDWETSEYNCSLPIDGTQDSEFQKMGLEFGPFQPKDKWRSANLPEGWTIEREGNVSYICDKRKRRRAVINKNEMRPLRRFRIGQDPYIENENVNVLFCIWDSGVPHPEDPKVVFEIRRTVPDKQQYKDIYNNRVKIYRKEFEEKALKWLADRFPDWESYSSHWDEE